MKTITIGGDLIVHRIGLGTNRIRENEESRVLLLGAVERGIDFIDTADYYGGYESERMIGKTLAPYPKGLIIATKGGMVPSDNTWNGTAEYLEKALEGSLERLKLTQIDLYQLHRVDPRTPLSVTITFLKEMKDAGKIRHIGLSEVTVAQIEEARSIVEIVSVQNQYNIITRKYEDVVDYCDANKIAFLPWFPLGHGRVNLEDERMVKLASNRSATVQQIALAWLLKRSPMMLPIPGTLSLKHLDENLQALNFELSDEEFAYLSEVGLRFIPGS
jgi:pyridoxine 4-dehydrogenase